jgi:hypothetical protein
LTISKIAAILEIVKRDSDLKDDNAPDIISGATQRSTTMTAEHTYMPHYVAYTYDQIQLDRAMLPPSADLERVFQERIDVARRAVPFFASLQSDGIVNVHEADPTNRRDYEELKCYVFPATVQFILISRSVEPNWAASTWVVRDEGVLLATINAGCAPGESSASWFVEVLPQ